MLKAISRFFIPFLFFSMLVSTAYAEEVTIYLYGTSLLPKDKKGVHARLCNGQANTRVQNNQTENAHSVPVNSNGSIVDDKPRYLGKVVAKDTHYGLLLEPHLTHLPRGFHGFHIHQLPSCDNDAQAAGGHYDPDNSGTHQGPYKEEGHKGDLPALYVNQYGEAIVPVFAPRLKVSEIIGKTLMIHQGSDNFSDEPEKLGGGGARIACGVINRS